VGGSFGSGMSAFRYYARCVGRNRTRDIIGRLANPAQAGALLITLVLGLVLSTSLIGAAQHFTIDLHEWLALVAALQIAAVWIGLPLQRRPWKQQLGLSYSEAEIERLFQAPLGRVPL
jgi:hypothetical protein